MVAYFADAYASLCLNDLRIGNRITLDRSRYWIIRSLFYASWDVIALSYCIARMHGWMRNDGETHNTGVTGLHDRRSRECNPVTPIECLSLSFRKHPCILAFIIYLLCINIIQMAPVWWIWCTLSFTFFKSIICFIALFNFGETCHSKIRWMVTVWRYCCYAAIVVKTRNCIMTPSGLNAYCDVTNIWMDCDYSLPSLNCPRAIHKQNSHTPETMGHITMTS